MSNRVVHFEIHADEPERAAKFYREALGWEITKWENPSMEYWMVMTAPQGSTEAGISGGLLKRIGPSPKADNPVSAFVCTAVVENFDEAAKKIEAAGGTLAMPKYAIANMAWQGYYKDTEGNIFGIHQPDPNAK